MSVYAIFLSIKIKEKVWKREIELLFSLKRFIHEFVVKYFIEENHYSINEENKSIEGRRGRRNHLRKHGGREREYESGSDAVFRGVDFSRVSISHRHCLASFFRMMVTRVPKETRQKAHHLVKHSALGTGSRILWNEIFSVPSGLGGWWKRRTRVFCISRFATSFFSIHPLYTFN